MGLLAKASNGEKGVVVSPLTLHTSSPFPSLPLLTVLVGSARPPPPSSSTDEGFHFFFIYLPPLLL